MEFSPKIKVTSPSFSKSKYLREELEKYFPNSEFNDNSREYDQNSLISFLSGSDGAIIGLDKIDDNILSKLNGIKIISKFGVGLDNIDRESCDQRGIYVGWNPGINKRSVSELILSLMISQCRNIYQSSYLLKNQHVWKKEGGYQLSEKTVGIIGVGNIGKDLIELLKPFNCNLLVNDIIDQPDYYSKNNLKSVSKEEIFRNADIITIHTPLNKDTHHLINEDTIGIMKRNAYLINAARGKIVNQSDLKNALINKRIAGAALDVYEIEPPTDKEFLSLPNLICTPHIGGSSIEGVNAMGMSAINHLREYFRK